MYLYSMLIKYEAKNLSTHHFQIEKLMTDLRTWANTCFISILNSGSRAKGTAISLASDVDYLISLTSDCNNNTGGLKECYNSLFTKMNGIYPPARKQNVSVRINLNGLSVDITPARKHSGNTNYHNLHVSKTGAWKQTNIQIHINDISNSGRTNEIKILKIWRELHKLDFPSIYLEYLLVNHILLYKPKDPNSLGDNVWHILNELAKTSNNPLFIKVGDPANTNNTLSELLDTNEKNRIIIQARMSIATNDWTKIIW